jgi:HSP20 family protein
MALEYCENGSLIVQADLPGIDPERDIQITIVDDVLHIRACRETGPEPRDHPSDLRDGAFSRDIALPAGTTEGEVKAAYRDDRLEVRAPLGASHPAQAVVVRVAMAETCPK